MILMVCANFPPEPVVAASLTYDLANELAASNEVRVLTPKPSRPFGYRFAPRSANGTRFKQVVLPSYVCSKSSIPGRALESYSFGSHVSRYIRKNQQNIDLVYICAWPLIAQYQITKTANGLGIPSVLHVEDIYPESLSNKIPFLGGLLNKMLLPMDALCLRMATKVVAVSENMKTNFMRARNIPPEKIALVQNWQDERNFTDYRAAAKIRKSDNQRHRPFTFMYLGNIGPVAGVDFIIRCFIQSKLIGARLIIAGSGSMKGKCQQITSNYSANIQFWDVPNGKVPEIQHLADVMLLPVKRGAALSSIPSKLSAYLFSQKPVIACVDEQSDTAQAIKNARCGWVVPPEDPDALAKVMARTLALPGSELRGYGMNGFKYASENLSKNKNLGKLVRLIHETRLLRAARPQISPARL